MSKLIFGCGYLGKRVATLWRDAGEKVYVVSRSKQRAERLRSEGFDTVVADVANVKTLVDLPQSETVLFAVGFDRSADHTIHEVYADGVKNVLAALPSSVKHFIYISTTGVYGDAAGDWVDESTPADPQRDGGKASLAAEQLLGENSTVLRLAGIYGPERIPYLDKLRAGEPIAAPSEGWLNLIHVDDAAAIVLAVDAEPRPAGKNVYCVSDGHPVVRGAYYQEVARLIHADPPQFVAPDSSSPAAARAAANKRISNAKLRAELQYEFTHVSYREGLLAILP